MTAPALRWAWQQSMLRVKEPTRSLKFYVDLLGMTLLDKYDFPESKFSLYFLATVPHGQQYTLQPGSTEAHKYLWNSSLTVLELTHNWGTENDAEFKYHPGNQERDGFGHLAVNCDDVYACCDFLEQNGVTFKKKPDEGRMKGIAFAYDPDGYWMEIVPRKNCSIPNRFNLSQTMLRVKDPKKSVPFYEALGMQLIRESHYSDFSLFFMCNAADATGSVDPKGEDASAFVGSLFNPVLELTHNHGTETQEDFAHHNGNAEPRRGFGHIGFLVDDVDAAFAHVTALGYGDVKKPEDGSLKGLAFVKDPDGYWVELVRRGGYGDSGLPYHN